MAGAGDPCDPVLMELFRAELETHLPALDQGLLDLEKGSDSPKVLEGMMRAAHSLKGAARIVGMEPAVRLAHVLEDCFVAAQKQEVRLNPEAVDVLLRGVDLLGQVTRAEVGSPVPEAELTATVEAIRAVREGRMPQTAAGRAAKAERPAGSADVLPSVPPEDRAIAVPDLSHDGAEALRCLIIATDKLGQGPRRLDFAAVRRMEPAALALLYLMARDRTLAAHGWEVCNLRPEVRRVLRAAGLEGSFPTTRTEETS